jgi:hypothetical protein
MSTTVAFTAGPVVESNTSRTGSSFPPIPRGCTSHDGVSAAMEGQISSMWAPSTLRFAGSKW